MSLNKNTDSSYLTAIIVLRLTNRQRQSLLHRATFKERGPIVLFRNKSGRRLAQLRRRSCVAPGNGDATQSRMLAGPTLQMFCVLMFTCACAAPRCDI